MFVLFTGSEEREAKLQTELDSVREKLEHTSNTLTERDKLWVPLYYDISSRRTSVFLSYYTVKCFH